MLIHGPVRPNLSQTTGAATTTVQETVRLLSDDAGMSMFDIPYPLIVQHFTPITTIVTILAATWVWRLLRRILWLVLAGGVTLAVMLFGVRPAVLPSHPEPSPPAHHAYR
jgi:hypothetical protein